MKINKKLLGAGAGAVCVVLCIAMLLSQCGRGGGNGETTPSTSPTTLPTAVTTAPTEQTTAPTAETTQPTVAVTEPSTEATEPVETTEATEPATETQPVHGSFKPGSTMSGSMSSNSGSTDTDTETTQPTEPQIEVAAPGTPSNAYTEFVNKVPSQIKTVKIPTGEPISYRFYNAGGQLLSIEDADAYIVYNGNTVEAVDGVVYVELESSPAALQIGSKANEEKAFTVNVLEPFGSAANPQVLKDISQFTASLDAGDEDGCFYIWTADSSGTIRLTPAAVSPDGVNCDIIITRGDESVSLSENAVVDEQTGVASVNMDVQEGEQITVQVVAVPQNGAYPAAQVTVNGSVDDSLGTEANPIEVYDIPLNTGNIPGGEELHYNIYGVAGMVLTIEDPDAYVTYNGVTYGADEDGVLTLVLEDGAPYIPVSLAIGNGGSTEKTYTANFTYPLGSFNNPEPLEALEEFSVSLEAGDTDGYHFSWNVEEEGTLSVWVNSIDPADAQYDVMLSSTGSYSSPLLSESENGIVTMDVLPGDVVTIKLEILPDSDWNVPAAQVSLGGMFTAPAGSAENPIWLTENENQVTVPANGTVYYQGYFGGTDMTVTGTPGFSVIYNEASTADTDGTVTMPVADAGRLPVIFAISGGTTEETYTVSFTHPLGSQENPQEIYGGSYTATITEGDSDGYYYKFSPLGSGLLTVTMDSGSGWQYFINNVTSSAYGDIHCSDDETLVSSETVRVNEGEEIIINVSTYDPEAPWSAPEGEVPFTVSFMSGTGSADEPFTLTDVHSQVSVAAGETVYYQGYFGGMEMTVSGESGFSVIYGGNTLAEQNGEVSTMVTAVGRNPVVFAITGGAADSSYDVSFTYPLGSMENPETLYTGKTTASIRQAGDSDGYFYKFTSLNNGVLTVTVNTESGWQYVVNNNTSYIYGDAHSSADDPQVRSEKIRVNEGDEIIVNVSTFDPNDPWNAPIGEVEFTVEFMAGTGTEADPYVLTDLENTVTVPAGDTVYYQGYFGGMVMTVNGQSGFTVSSNGVSKADAEGTVSMEMVAVGRNPVVFSIVNTGAEQQYDVVFTYPLGSMENCAEVVIGEKNTATLAAADMDGYFFSWIATGDGTLTITIDEEASVNGWQYVVNDLTSYTYGENHTSADETPVSSVTIEVKQGDEVQINLNTFDPADVWNTPAGEVVFDAAFTPAQ